MIAKKENWLAIHEVLRQRIADWEVLGHPSLLERFVERNGKAFMPVKRKGRKRRAKECFKNAADYVLRSGGTYVEGFVTGQEMLWWPIHHAWVTLDGDDAMDPTLESEGRNYFGIAFDSDTLKRETLRLGSYGLLDHGLGFNTELIFKIDPALEAICCEVAKKRHAIMEPAHVSLVSKK